MEEDPYREGDGPTADRGRPSDETRRAQSEKDLSELFGYDETRRKRIDKRPSPDDEGSGPDVQRLEASPVRGMDPFRAKIGFSGKNPGAEEDQTSDEDFEPAPGAVQALDTSPSSFTTKDESGNSDSEDRGEDSSEVEGVPEDGVRETVGFGSDEDDEENSPTEEGDNPVEIPGDFSAETVRLHLSKLEQCSVRGVGPDDSESSIKIVWRLTVEASGDVVEAKPLESYLPEKAGGHLECVRSVLLDWNFTEQKERVDDGKLILSVAPDQFAIPSD